MRSFLLSAILLVYAQMSAQVTWEATASTLFIEKSQLSHIEFANQTNYLKISDSLFQRSSLTAHEVKSLSFQASSAIEFGVQVRIKLHKLWAIRSGLLLRHTEYAYTSIRLDRECGVGLRYITDTLAQSLVPRRFVDSDANVFTNTTASVGPASDVTKYGVWYLGVPLLADFALMPERLYFSAGLYLQAPIASKKRWDEITTQFDETKTPVEVTYVYQKYNERKGIELRDAAWQLSASLTYQCTNRIKIELGARKTNTNISFEPYSDTTLVQSKTPTSYMWQTSVRYRL